MPYRHLLLKVLVNDLCELSYMAPGISLADFWNAYLFVCYATQSDSNLLFTMISFVNVSSFWKGKDISNDRHVVKAVLDVVYGVSY